jgi:hypothetical protein
MMLNLHPKCRNVARIVLIDVADDTLNATVLRGGVGTRHAKINAVGEEEGARAHIIELATIVALECLYGDAVLCMHKGNETKSVDGVRFKAWGVHE